ncbi:MAG: hypothetical protein HQL26_00420 [Candidatus Omnitrophica bacterium]|nr:hypothetical protein [Candidatus Omnitrophota bacterium]
MNNKFFNDLGQQFYAWYRDHKIRFEYGGQSKDLELEVERITGLINYVEKKKASLLDKKII